MNTIIQDLRFALRAMLKNPGFTLLAVLTLALGIGANTTIFSAIDTLVLHPFAFANQERLLMLWEQNLEVDIDHGEVAPGNFNDWREQNQTLEQVVAIDQSYFDLTDGSEPERFLGYDVSPEFFETLGVQAAHGRVFTTQDVQPDNHQFVVLKHSLWQRRFGSDPNIINQTLTLNGKSYVVLGVMPPDFNFPFNRGEMWVPLVFDAKLKAERKHHYLQVLAMLKPGVTLEQASADLNSIALRSQQQYPQSNSGRTVLTAFMSDDMVRHSKTYSPVLLGAVGFVLLIACANVANLLLVRGASRQKEIAIRLAMGATRFRLIRQLLTESLLLALVGGACGLLLSIWGVEALARGIPQEFSEFIPGWHKLGLNQMAFVFTLLISVVTGLLFGLVPALQTTKTNFNEALKEGGKGAPGKGAHHRTRSWLVISEVALSLVLLIGAGLMIRSFVELLRANLGVKPENVLTMRISLTTEKYAKDEARIHFYQQLLSRIKSLPTVANAGVISDLPMGGSSASRSLQSISQTVFQAGKEPNIDLRVVTPSYFAAMGTALLKGRNFTEQDDQKSTGVVIVNEAFVQRFFADQNPLGQHFKMIGDQSAPLEIIGVAANVMNDDMDDKAQWSMYLPYSQASYRAMDLVVRTNSEPTLLTAAIRSEVNALDKDLPVFNVKTMSNVIGERLSPKRLTAFLLGFFALIALLLASVGIYAVMSYMVSQRTHEIGIRLALGAPSGNIFKLVVGQGLLLTGIGLGLGFAGAIALTRAMSGILYGVSATDPLTFIGISLLLALVAFLACFLPARRATKVDPMVALRCE
ncbi:MAG: ABC transporter permease [Acidobacteria bacterium]|nr:ABC transporter permease [Acidobacteriota bacterium]